MTKKEEYQRFVSAMCDLTDRPGFLQPMFARGLTFDQARDELASFKRNGEKMFKAARHGFLDRPTSKNRIITLEAMQRVALRGALDMLASVYHRRMTPEARAWRTQQMELIKINLTKRPEALDN